MKVGDYVRTKYGEICKLKEPKYNVLIYSTDIEIDRYNDRDCNDYGFDNDTIKDIIKSSPNIIDLIQEGDILKVNDFKDVYTIYEVEMFRNPYTNEKYLGIRNDIGKKPKRLYEIPLVNLSIVTKEQFESMEYKL